MTISKEEIKADFERFIRHEAMRANCTQSEIREIIESKQEEPVSEDLEEAAWLYYDKNRLPIPPEWNLHKEFIDFFKAGAKWGKNQAEVEIQAQSMALAHGCPKERISDALSAEIEEIWGRHSFFNFDLMQNVASLSKKEITEIAHHFTNWQKEQFEKNRLAACDRQTEEEAEIERDFCMGIIENEHRQPTFDDAIKYGMRLQKQQIMKDVVEVGEAHIVWVEDNGRAFPELDDSVNDMLMPGDISKHFKGGDKVWIYLTKEKLLYLEKDEEIKKVIIKE